MALFYKEATESKNILSKVNSCEVAGGNLERGQHAGEQAPRDTGQASFIKDNRSCKPVLVVPETNQ